MVVKIKNKLKVSLLILILILTTIIIIPEQISATTSYVNNTLMNSYKEFGLGMNFDSWNQTSLFISTSDSINLKDYTSTDILIQNIIIYNDSNNNGLFDQSEENIMIVDQLNFTNFSPNPPDQTINGTESVQGKLVNLSAWNDSINPNVTFSIRVITFNAPTEYENISFNYLETQFKIYLNIINWPSWGPNIKLLLVYNITSQLSFYKQANQLSTGMLDENPGPDLDDDEYKLNINWLFFENATLNSSSYQPCNQTINSIGKSWIINCTFNKFENLSFNGSKISIILGTTTNNFLFFVLFAIMLIGIIITVMIIYYTRERRNKFLEDIG
ncbi:MAG: hypothetical protein EAX96_14345 [Candidatus Lokiarchaeota archaeon]|nr:hypothetical protein [Candidatus Lokiarchaeota archaeon]